MTQFILVKQGDYNPGYLKLLSAQIREHYGPSPICLTDKSVGFCPEIQLKDPELTGWWSKMELFAPWNNHLRPFWYLDLDSYVMEDISFIADHNSTEFFMCREWLNADNITWSQSSMMFVPDAEISDHIWNTFVKNKENNAKTPGGDQVFLSKFKHKFIQDVYPDLIGSYKCHKQQEKRKTKIVTFHGRPKQENTEGWAGEVWKA